MMMGPRPRPEDVEAELHRSLGLDPADPSLAGEKVVNVPLPPEALDRQDPGARIEVITPPTRKPMRPTARALPPVDISPVAEPSPRAMSPSIDEEMAAARAADRNSRVGSLLQQASLDISGGLLNRDLGRAPTQPENNAGGLRAMREAAAKAALEARKVANESEALAQREKDRRENEAQQERFHADSMSSAKTAHEDAQENARAMRELAKGNQAIAGEHLKISKTELDDKQAAKATRDAALAVRVDGGEFKPRSTGIPDPVANDWRKTAGLYSSALVGMSDLEKSIRNYVANPGISTKNDMTSRLQAVASALNSANGGGAMSEAERRNVADALGADVVSPEGFAAVMMRIAGDDPTKAAKILLSKLNAARDTTRHQMVAKGDAAGFDFAPAGAPAPAAHPLDSEAVKWARSNPKDPRAAAILRANGVQ